LRVKSLQRFAPCAARGVCFLPAGQKMRRVRDGSWCVDF
jgi:hypothetical protein